MGSQKENAERCYWEKYKENKKNNERVYIKTKIHIHRTCTCLWHVMGCWPPSNKNIPQKTGIPPKEETLNFLTHPILQYPDFRGGTCQVYSIYSITFKVIHSLRWRRLFFVPWFRSLQCRENIWWFSQEESCYTGKWSFYK